MAKFLTAQGADVELASVKNVIPYSPLDKTGALCYNKSKGAVGRSLLKGG